MVAIVGPTATGKSQLAIRLAEELDGVILSTDSMQVYRGMDIGTAKPTEAEQARVPHFMIDLVDPSEDFSVAQFQAQGREVLAAHADRVVLVTGGSGLHLRALLDPMEFPPHDPDLRTEIDAMEPAAAQAALVEADPAAGDVMDLANPRRVSRALEVVRLTGRTPSARVDTPEYRALQAYEPFVPFVARGVDAGPALAARVNRRIAAMLESGLVDEVAGLAGRLGATASQAVGYKELLPHLRGEQTLEAATDELTRSTLGLVKRQRTFFRRDPRVQWLEWHEDPEVRYSRLRASLDRLG